MRSKREWILGLEAELSERIPFHPNVLSLSKIAVSIPLLFLVVSESAALPVRQAGALGLFLLFAALDYLDGTVARHRDIESRLGRVLDRVTDAPMLLVLAYTCKDIIPLGLIGAKIGLDLLLLALYLLGKGEREHRMRTATGAATLLVLLIAGQGWISEIVTPNLVAAVLGINIAFTAVVSLYLLKVLQKRFIADALSAANLLCGVFSMGFAASGRFDLSLLLLMLGAAFDGFDGAAARKFGGTRFGVYSDDIADGVNYGIAPGVALYFALGGAEGAVIGAFYSVFTLSRLVFFTLNKAYSDPNFFCGVPSTVGGIVVLSAIILFPASTALLGLLVGVACVQMVSFDVHYRHLGRALASNRRVIYGMPAAVLLLLGGRLFWDPLFPVAAILLASLVYGFLPTVAHFINVIRRRGEAEEAAVEAETEAPEGKRVAVFFGKLLDRLGHISLPLAGGILVGFYFSDQGMSFLPSTLTIALGLLILGALSMPLGRLLQGRAFTDTAGERRIRRRVVVLSAVAALAAVVRLAVFLMEAPSPLTEMPRKQLDQAMAIDGERLRSLIDGMERAVTFADGMKGVLNEEKTEVLTADQERRLLDAWRTFYDNAAAVDGIRDFYEDWYRFDPSRRERAYHLRSFLLSQSAELALFKNSRRMVALVKKNENVEKFLNNAHEAAGLGPDTVSLLRQEILGTRDEAIVRGGWQYLKLLEKGLNGREEAAELGVLWLWKQIEDDMAALESDEWPGVTAVRADLQAIKRPLERTWFSTQKKVAGWMGDTRVRRIGKYLITRAQQEEMDKSLEPGDIMLARKNWYLSNVGLPGFWPHAILYLGDHKKLTAYFDAPEVKGYLKTLTGREIPLAGYLQERFPEAWGRYIRSGEDGANRVIEAVSEGVVLSPLDHVVGDYTAVLRPRLPKLAKAQAIIAAFTHYGKPYDFDFDFATDDKLVCTELVWRSYRHEEGKQGIHLPLVEIMGRRTMPANEIAKAYAEQRERPNPSLEFVYFLDASEILRKAFKADEEAFAASYLRSKWDIALP